MKLKNNAILYACAVLIIITLSGCGLDNPTPISLEFIYSAPQSCNTVDVVHTTSTSDGVTKTLNDAVVLSKSGAVANDGAYWASFWDSVGNRSSAAHDDTYTVTCRGSDRPAATVNTMTPAFPSNTYAGQTVVIKDDSTQPSGFIITVLLTQL